VGARRGVAEPTARDLPLLGGRISPATLRSGTVVRDEQEFELAPDAGGEELVLDLELLDADGAVLSEAGSTLGSIVVAGRNRVFDSANEERPREATFGSGVGLISHALEPRSAKRSETVTVRLRWQGLERIERAYKIFVHVMDPSAERVLAQRDAEPLSGRAPTSSWRPGEIIDDEFPVQLPADLAPGEYPIEIGVYDERSGTRLLLPNGDNRFILATRLQVR